jgi:ribokinase
MRAARQKGVETIINPAPAVPLPEEAYQELGHLIVNETEAAILSGIENPTSWDKVAAVFIARGVKNVIITLGGEVSSHQSLRGRPAHRLLGRFLQDSKATVILSGRPHRTRTQGQGR